MVDVTSIWVQFTKHRSKVGVLIAALLVFLSGWQFGRITSPYYASHPIIFQDREGSGVGGSLTDLQALQAEAQGSPVSNTGAVAGTVTPDTTAQGNYVASVNSTLYHHRDCSSANRINPENQVWFATPEEAQAAGFSPSSCTQQRE